ncbi:MAG TPA: RNA polymerase sigma factor [Polyangiaceae bacterium]|nr:RNA polymerase sigma factor [Polyangiaceae bacterium]
MAPLLRPPLTLVPEPRSRGGEGPDSDRPGPALDDSAVIAGLKARDTTASSAFYERVRPAVDRTLTRLIGPRDSEYEDLAQRALVELVGTIHSFRGDCPLDAWVSIVTARLTYRTIRRRRVERRLFAQAPGEGPELVTRSHAGMIAARQAIERVRLELSNMDPSRAWAFLLHDVYGYDLKEVSQITGASLSATQSRLMRGRREIHERIRNDEALARFLRHDGEDA